MLSLYGNDNALLRSSASVNAAYSINAMRCVSVSMVMSPMLCIILLYMIRINIGLIDVIGRLA